MTFLSPSISWHMYNIFTATLFTRPNAIGLTPFLQLFITLVNRPNPIGLKPFQCLLIFHHDSSLIHADMIGHTPFLAQLIAFITSSFFVRSPSKESDQETKFWRHGEVSLLKKWLRGAGINGHHKKTKELNFYRKWLSQKKKNFLQKKKKIKQKVMFIHDIFLNERIKWNISFKLNEREIKWLSHD